MTHTRFVKVICVDFDGVIHSYGKGWQGGEIYGHVVPGFWEWAEDMLCAGFALAIYSSRSKTPEGVSAMRAWLIAKAEEHGGMASGVGERLLFAHEKPPAWLTIDDRAVRFDGNWGAPELRPDAVDSFKPWTQRDG